MKLISFHIDLDDKWVVDHTAQVHHDSVYLEALEKIERIFLLRGVPVTLFVVGKDLEVESKRKALQRINTLYGLSGAALIEFANHTFSHNNDILKNKSTEIAQTHELIFEHLGQICCGFRSPGYVFHHSILHHLADIKYRYDSSALPTGIGPILRILNRLQHGVVGERNFGTLSNFCLPNMPFLLSEFDLIELPVTVMPIFRLPIHFSIWRGAFPELVCNLLKKLSMVVYIFHLTDFFSQDYLIVKQIDSFLDDRKAVLACEFATMVTKEFTHA